MGTMTKQRVEVSVNVMEKSVTYMANTLFLLAFRIVNARGLKPDFITKNRKTLEDGFFTWLAEQTLESVHVEIISLTGSKALERWDVSFDYSADPDNKVRKPPIEELADVCSNLRRLPRGTRYRIVVHTKPGASKVPGWYETTFKPFTQAREEELSGWGYGHIGAKLFYREGSWDGKSDVS